MKQPAHKFQYIEYDNFIQANLVGRSEREIKDFALKLIQTGYLINPISVIPYRNKYKVIDGVKRVLAVQYIQRHIDDQDAKDMFFAIPAIVYDEMPPGDRAAVSIIANEHRSDNPIAAYLHMKELQERGEWEELNELLNHNRFKKLATFDELMEREFFFDQFNEGNIAITTLFKVAKLSPPRQEIAFKTLKEEEKLTGGDVREIREAQSDEVLSAMDFDLEAPTKGGNGRGKFVYVNGDEVSEVIHGFKEAMGKDYKGTLYKLIPVGGRQ